IGFVDSNDLDTFGFLNPDVIIWVVHLEPVFARGCTFNFLPLSITQHPDEQNKDWKCFYINICIDRDMLMCFCALGVGHK
ncbi:hypothetical protein ARMGADRAFT_875666, partial [Armillaria gallica]